MRVDIQSNDLLSSAVLRLNVPPMRCHGSVTSCGRAAAFKRGSTGAMVFFMPIETAIFVVCVVAVFAGFGAVLAWANHETTGLQH
jgi:hypothetical protein